MYYGLIIENENILGSTQVLVENSIEVTKEEFEIYNENPTHFALKNGIMLNITDTQGYLRKKRFEEIEQKLEEADRVYETIMDTSVLYTNGQYYKPKYAQESYVLLLAADIFPITIWDSTEINSVQMSKNDLLMLSMFLKNIAEPAFQTRKTTRLELLTERESLV